MSLYELVLDCRARFPGFYICYENNLNKPRVAWNSKPSAIAAKLQTTSPATMSAVMLRSCYNMAVTRDPKS